METDLHAVIRANILEEVHKQYIMYQIFRSLKYMHAAQLLHRDIKVRPRRRRRRPRRGQCWRGASTLPGQPTHHTHPSRAPPARPQPSNVLLNSECQVKMADFGLARSVAQLATEEGNPVLTDYVATRWYRAPEILLSSHRYTYGVDMWACGE